MMGFEEGFLLGIMVGLALMVIACWHTGPPWGRA